MAGYQSESAGAQYVPVYHNESESDRTPASGGVSKKTVGIFVTTLVAMCLIVAAFTSTHSAPAPSAAVSETAAVPALEAKKQKEKQPPIVNPEDVNVCADPNYSSETLKLAHEMSVVALLAKPEAANPGPVFETSCILNVGDWFYAVSDDSPSIAKIRTRLTYNDPQNSLIPPSKPLVDGPQTEMGFEALFYDEKTDVFTAVIEAVPLDGEPNMFHSMFYDLKIRPDGSMYDVQHACPSDFEFTSGNKGFEGAALVKNSKGEEFVLGLCEGNFCEGGKRGRTPGNGRVVVLKRAKDLTIHGKSYECGWTVVTVIELPPAIAFRDYSAITLYGADPSRLRVAIASQENSAVWIGHYNADTRQFLEDEARLFDFPRDGDCEVVYCNVEGLDFLNEDLLIAASDQMKNAGRQNSRCLAKDQSIHVFVIPPVPEVVVPEGPAAEAPSKEESKKGKGKGKAAKGKGKKAEAEEEAEAAPAKAAAAPAPVKAAEAVEVVDGAVEASKGSKKQKKAKKVKADTEEEAEEEQPQPQTPVQSAVEAKKAKKAKKAEEEPAAAPAPAEAQAPAEAEAEEEPKAKAAKGKGKGKKADE